MATASAPEPAAPPVAPPEVEEPSVAPPPLPSLPEGDEQLPPFSGVVTRLPVELDVSIAVRGFRVRNVLALAPGQIVETTWIHGEDVPLRAGEVLLAWAEFEVVDSQLAVRITRLP